MVYWIETAGYRYVSQPLSAIHFQGPRIRLVSCYTLLSRCRLPWPRPSCLHAGTPFVVGVMGAFGTLTRLSVQPAAPVLLTSNGPLNAVIMHSGHRRTRPGIYPQQIPLGSTPIRVSSAYPFGVWESAKAGNDPDSASHSLYRILLKFGISYSGEHFGENQLPASSIGLSPLYPRLTIDLHVRTASGFHQSFPRLYPTQA